MYTKTFYAENLGKSHKGVAMEDWIELPDFPGYSVSSEGRVINNDTERVMALSKNQYDVVYVGLMDNGQQYHRSVALLVATHFVSKQLPAFDTPINLDGDRSNNEARNLVWRPRWFAVQYNRQFRDDWSGPTRITNRIEDIKTGETARNSFECAKRYGLLERDIVLSIINRTYVWPTFQEFRVIEL